MWPFSVKKEQINVSETFEARLKATERQITELYADHDILRNKILRKIQSKRVISTDEDNSLKKRTGIVSDQELQELREHGII